MKAFRNQLIEQIIKYHPAYTGIHRKILKRRSLEDLKHLATEGVLMDDTLKEIVHRKGGD